jgi:hypothetical protein
VSSLFLEVLCHRGVNWYVTTKTAGELHRTVSFGENKAEAADYVRNHPWIIAKRCKITFDGCTQSSFFELEEQLEPPLV